MAEATFHAETSPEEARAFTMKLGEALHRYGAPAHRLEEAMIGTARRLGL